MRKRPADMTRSYLAGISVADDMFRHGLIDEADYSALEAELATKFMPLFRYEKACRPSENLKIVSDNCIAKYR